MSLTPFHFIRAYPTVSIGRTVAFLYFFAANYQFSHILSLIQERQNAGLVLGTSQGAESRVNDPYEVIVLFVILVVDFEAELLPSFKDVVHHEALGEVRVEIVHYRFRPADMNHVFAGVPLEEDLDIGITLAEEVEVTQPPSIQK